MKRTLEAFLAQEEIDSTLDDRVTWWINGYRNASTIDPMLVWLELPEDEEQQFAIFREFDTTWSVKFEGSGCGAYLVADIRRLRELGAMIRESAKLDIVTSKMKNDSHREVKYKNVVWSRKGEVVWKRQSKLRSRNSEW